MTPHVMLDCETLGVSNTPVILSIGAVKFTDTEILERFHVAINPETCTAFGLKIDASTVMWWLDNDRQAAREALLSNEQHDLPTALDGFAQWYRDGAEAPQPVWSHGATADLIWMRNAFSALNMELPWSYRDERCFRTIKALVPGLVVEDQGVEHDALSDATWQAKYLQKAIEHLGIGLV